MSTPAHWRMSENGPSLGKMTIRVIVDIPSYGQIDRAIQVPIDPHDQTFQKLDYPDKKSMDRLLFNLLCSNRQEIVETERRREHLAQRVSQQLVAAIKDAIGQRDTVNGYTQAEQRRFYGEAEA